MKGLSYVNFNINCLFEININVSDSLNKFTCNKYNMNEKIILIIRILGLKFSFPIELNHNTSVNSDSRSINIPNVKVSTTIEYLNDYGIVINKKIEGVKFEEIHLTLRSSKPSRFGFFGVKKSNQLQKTLDFNQFRNLSLFYERLDLKNDIIINKEIDSIINIKNPKYEKNINNYKENNDKNKYLNYTDNIKNRNTENTNLNYIDNIENINDNQNPGKNQAKNSEKYFKNAGFIISRYNYWIIKLIKLVKIENYEIIFTYTEIEYIPTIVQVLFHIPLLITAIIIFLAILTFDPEINKNIVNYEINKLPIQKYNKDMECTDCSVCLELFYDGEDIRVLNCNHYFHKCCIDSWLHTSLRCPICRNSVLSYRNIQSFDIYQNYNYV